MERTNMYIRIENVSISGFRVIRYRGTFTQELEEDNNNRYELDMISVKSAFP